MENITYRRYDYDKVEETSDGHREEIGCAAVFIDGVEVAMTSVWKQHHTAGDNPTTEIATTVKPWREHKHLQDQLEGAVKQYWKNEGYNVGELTEYDEDDAVLPERTDFELLPDSCTMYNIDTYYGFCSNIKVAAVYNEYSSEIGYTYLWEEYHVDEPVADRWAERVVVVDIRGVEPKSSREQDYIDSASEFWESQGYTLGVIEGFTYVDEYDEEDEDED